MLNQRLQDIKKFGCSVTMLQRKWKFYRRECIHFILLNVLLCLALAQSDDNALRIAFHDLCDVDDQQCGLCCCKPLDDMALNKSEIDHVAVEALCHEIEVFPADLPNGTKTLKLVDTTFQEIAGSKLNSEHLLNLTTIFVWKNFYLQAIRNDSFTGLLSLHTLIFENLPKLTTIEPNAFNILPNLRELRLKNTGIHTVPLFTGLAIPGDSSYLEQILLVLEDTQLTRIPTGSFQSLPERIRLVHLSWNSRLSTIEDFAFNGSKITQLYLNNNEQLSNLHERAFAGLDDIHELSLSGTPIDYIPTVDLKGLLNLNLEDASNLLRFPTAQSLPSLRNAKLTYPYHCCALISYGFGNFFQENINSDNQKILFPCNSSDKNPVMPGWAMPFAQDDNEYEKYEDSGSFYDLGNTNITVPDHVHTSVDGDVVHYYDESADPKADDVLRSSSYIRRLYYSSSQDGSWSDTDDHNSPSGDDVDLGGWREPRTDTPSIAGSVELCYYDENGKIVHDVYKTPVKCTPEPDAFNPCENVLGSNFLPAISWIVSALAILGNFFVILVLSVVTFDKTCARRQHHLSVQKFLVLNLAIADMCMGLYLLTISAMDAKTSGEYYKYGAEWQTGLGCKIAGFLSIFSSQLSVYTLSVISLERWYAIRFAIQLEKRMTIRCAKICILIGWILAGVLATLPLVGVNNYEKTSICLPFDVSTTPGSVYVSVLLFIAIGAFFVDVVCYLWMYANVRNVGISNGRKRKGSLTSSKTGAYRGTTATADAVVAKRMAVLVFTNFACFFPISFFTLTAAAGYPLISISESKILLVIFYPVNSCCNPFLYAIMTKSFRRDLLAWLTSRGYCAQFAAKLNGANWRRNSVDPGSTERRESAVRKKIRRCMKFVTIKKPMPYDVSGDGSVFKESNGCFSSKRSSMRRDSLKPHNYYFCPNKPAANNNHRDKMNYRSCDEQGCVSQNGRSQSPVAKFFKISLVKKNSENRPESHNYRKIKTGLSNIMCFKTYQNPEESSDPANDPSPEASSPLMDGLYSKNEMDFSSRPNFDSKPPNYGRRSSRSRHSTTTIETRLTVNGCNREAEDICSTAL